MFGIKDWNIEALTGYKPITTYWSDFSIAERFGEKEVRDTYKRAFKFHHDDIKWMTEICMVLNWKIHEHYGINDRLAELYDELWRKCDSWILECEDNDDKKFSTKKIRYKHFTEDEIKFFLSTID